VGNIHDELEQMAGSVATDLEGISAKFSHQLDRLLSANDDAETKAHLQERISKACSFFTGKITELVCDKLDIVTWHTDNKEVRKSVNPALEKLRMEASVKRACLQACEPGFQIKRYLDAKARASVAPAKKPVKALPVEDSSGTILHPELFNRMKSWRARKAMEKGQSHYMILHQKTLVTLVNFLPRSMASLKTIKGMGSKKADEFGPELLDIIGQYCQERNIGQTQSGIQGSPD